MKVWGVVPDHWEELIKKAAKIEGWDETSPYIRELIKNDLKAKGLLGKNGQVVEHEEEVEEVIV